MNGVLTDVAGLEAEQVREFWWWIFSICSFVYLIVLGFLLTPTLRSRDGLPPPSHRRLLGGMWASVLLSALLLLLLILANFHYSQPFPKATSKFRDDHKNQPVVEVIGKRWWWAIRYKTPDGKLLFESANELYLPVGEAITLQLTSADVIHSFWVPRLGGKRDLVPGHQNTLTLQIQKEGVFRGQCAEFCGLQHAHMAFKIFGVSRKRFDSWMKEQQREAFPPQTKLAQEGKMIFQRSRCADCHSIQGVSQAKVAVPGPDLTHVASRSTLAAATIENRRGPLSAWIADPHGIKPGVLMPRSKHSPQQLRALLAYMESLQ